MNLRFLFKSAAILSVALPLSQTGAYCQSENSGNYALLIRGRPIFAMPILWMGNIVPDDATSADLWQALQQFDRGARKGIEAVELYVANNPRSPWTPSLRANLAEYYRNTGRYTLALGQWEEAWAATKDQTDENSRQISARTLGYWTRLLASLGRKDVLARLLNDAQSRGIDTSGYASMIQGTRDGLVMMAGRPGVSYRCGTFALAEVSKIVTPDNKGWRSLQEIASPEGGFTMNALMTLGRTNGINLVAMRRESGTDLVVPSIVHWKLDHYAAILEQAGSRYKVVDPTFGNPRWLEAETINTESSGYFLIPTGKHPINWKELTSEEASLVVGKGGPNGDDPMDDQTPNDDDPDDDPCDPPPNPPGAGDGACVSDDPSGASCDPCDPPPPGDGMSIWRVSEPHISLWLHDTPLFYRNSSSWMKLMLSYNHRGEPKDGHFASFGDRWECNWLNLIEVNTNLSMPLQKVGGGGQRSFDISGSPEYVSGSRFSLQTGFLGLPIPLLKQKYGATTKFDYILQYLSGEKTNYFMSDKVDRYGRKTHFDYETVITNGISVVRLKSLTDIDSKLITFSYTNTTHPELITAVTDPYARVARFFYDTSGWLTNITDMSGLVSSFQYDSTGFITNMHTDYGDTRFSYASATNMICGSTLNRALEVTEPGGLKQLFTYRDHCLDSNNVPLYGDFVPGDGIYEWRNSFHWNRQQYAALSAQARTNYFDMPKEDYWKASLKHWLHKSGGVAFKVSDTLSTSAGPYMQETGSRCDNVYYYYYGQDLNPGVAAFAGSNKWVTTVSKSVGGYYRSYLDITRNACGRPLTITHSSDIGASISFTNEYDLDGTRLLRQVGPHGELIRGFGYSDTDAYLMTVITNAVTNVTRLTHDSTTKYVTSITTPGGLTTTNLYYTSGAASNFLMQRIDIGFRTNAFSYVNGNLTTQTDSLGLVSAQSWDNLNRIVSQTYPDGSSLSNIYDKLDMVGTKDRMGNWSLLKYNSVRQIVVTTNANGGVHQYQYCDCGAVSQDIAWLGSRALTNTYFYDIAGRLTNEVFSDNYAVTYDHDSASHPTSATDSNGKVVHFAYNAYGVLQHISLGDRTYLHRDFDEYGRVIRTIDLNGVTTTNSYDYLDRIVARRIIGSQGSDMSGLEEFAYNSRGLAIYTDAIGKITRFGFNEDGAVTAQTNAENEVLQFSYNPANQLIKLVDGKGQETRWNYDSFGRVTNKVDNSGNEMFRYKYDLEARLTNRWQAGGFTTSLAYDPVGNLTNVVYSSGSNITFRYDSLSRLTNMVDGIGSTTFTWTDAGQLLGEDGPWASDSLSYEYLGQNRTAIRLQQKNASDWAQGYAYDEYQRLTNVTSPAGSFTSQYHVNSHPDIPGYLVSDTIERLDLPCGAYIETTQDELGRLGFTVLSKSDGSTCDSHSYQYNEGHQKTRRTFADGNYLEFAYDKIGQLKTASGKEQNGITLRSHEQFGYSYDGAWNLTVRTNGGLTQAFTVNSINQVTTVTRSGNATIAGSVAGLPNSLTIKDNANLAIAATLYGDNSFARTNVSLLDGSNTFTAIAHDLHGRGDTNVVTVYNPVTVAYQYDVRGNMTNNGRQILTYDDGNQLISLLQSNACKSELSYDGLMRLRIRRDFGWLTTLNGWQCTNEVRYVYDGRLVVQERDAHDIAIVTYTRGNDLSGALAGAGGIGGLLARTDMRLLAIGSSGAHSYYYADGEGNVTMLIDQNQVPVAKYRYDPFGNVISAIGPIANVNLYRFSSKEYNPDYDIYYFGFRFYIPSLQRWLNRDPSEESGGFNLYGFVENDPNGFIDFYGLGGCHVWDIYNDPKANQQMDRRQAAENQKDTDLLKALAKQAAEMAKQSLNPESMIAGAFPAGGMGGAAKSLGGAAKAVSAADTAAAMAARDRVLAKIAENVANKTLSQNRANNISTVVGAVDTSTGKAVAAAKTSGIHGNQCAEDLAAKALGGDNPNIRYTPAIRPRNDKVIPPCDNCAAKYSGRFLTP